MPISSVQPKFGDNGGNYDVGYVGFVFHNDSFVSKGIVWFSRWDKGNMPPVSHTLIVTGPNSCVEAQAVGVVDANLTQYFDDPSMHIFFRKPIGWTLDIGNAIVKRAEEKAGKTKYNFCIIATDALAATYVGHFFNRLFNQWPNKILSYTVGWLGMVCSMLVAYALQANPLIAYKGCLQYPIRIITPQMLAKDDEIFVSMKSSTNE